MKRFVSLPLGLRGAAGFMALVVVWSVAARGADAPVPASRLADREESQPRPRKPMANGLTPQEAAKAMSGPPGFSVKLLAAEPEVLSPARGPPTDSRRARAGP